ncbi:hypothetical protein Csa_004934 [Cucumis sativus]|nr:hypothetical protein Csa_004934 [Cucumis sativus]
MTYVYSLHSVATSLRFSAVATFPLPFVFSIACKVTYVTDPTQPHFGLGATNWAAFQPENNVTRFEIYLLIFRLM